MPPELTGRVETLGTCKIVLLHITPNSEPLNDQGREGGLWIEQAGGNDHNVDVLASQTCNINVNSNIDINNN